jgi:type 1 glutamine amidotransferase
MIALLLLTALLPEPDKLPAIKELPDPLVAFDGTKITTAEQWNTQRRPELKRLFQHYMYGEFPPAGKVSAKIVRTDDKALEGKAILQEITLTLTPGGDVHLLLVLPKDRPGPVPVFVGMSFEGNHALLDDPKIRLPDVWMYPTRAGVVKNKATDASRGTAKNVWAIDQTIARGYGVATFYNGDIDPDRKEVRGPLKKAIDPENKAGTIAAWAWGISRVVDYLVTRDDIDSKRLITVGHSRLGKTALLAAAMDDRIAMAIPNQAGCGGTAPSRGTVGESVERINTSFPHWFNDRFKQFNKEPQRLPFDQHCLAALMAPRPVLFSNATEDTWANPNGQFDVLVAADPVYRKLGVDGLETKTRPPEGKLSAGRLGYYIRPGKHSMTREDWAVYLDFADKHLGAKKTSAQKPRLLLIGHGPDGHPAGTHEYIKGLKILAEDLKAHATVQTTIAEGAWKEGPEQIARCDAAVLFVPEGAAWLDQRPNVRTALREMLQRGGGLVVLHWAMGTRKAEPVADFVALVGGCHGGPDRQYAIRDTRVCPADRDHPVTRGLKPFAIKDEFYYKLKLAPGVSPLLTADIDGEAHVVAWAYMPGIQRGRAFGFSGLHFHENWQRLEYRKLITNAVCWAAGLAS